MRRLPPAIDGGHPVGYLVGWVARAVVATAAIIGLVGAAPRPGEANCALVPQAVGPTRILDTLAVGRCTAPPAAMPNGDVAQPTTTGLVVVRKADGRAAFTNGRETWIEGPTGVRRRANLDRFDWESATRDEATGAIPDDRGPGATLDGCLVPGARPAPDLRAACADLVEAVIDATEHRASGPLLAPREHVVLVDWRGMPVAYVDDGTNAFAYDGAPAFYVMRDLVFAYSGTFLGWIVDGVIRDRDGDAVLAMVASKAAPPRPPVAPEPVRASKRAIPRKGTREIPALQPPSTAAWTRPDRFGITY